MKLISARVTNYKNIIDSGEFTLDDVTCLVGKNQSGKSTLLHALYRLNPVEKGLHGFNYESDYPKAGATEYSKGMDREDRAHDVVVAGRFALDSEDVEAIRSDLGANSYVSEKHEIEIHVDYNERRVWHGLSFDEREVLKHLTAISTISEATKDFLLQLGSFENVRELYGRAELDEVDEDLLQELSEFRNQNQYLFEHGVVTYAIIKILVPRVPRFVYYDVYSQMPHRIVLHEFIDKLDPVHLDANDLPMLGMLRLGGLEPRDLIDQGRTDERNTTELETANARITAAIAPYWKVGSEFRTVLGIASFKEADDPNRVGESALTVRINDVQEGPQSSWLSTSLTARSRGFQWMFSFACLLRYLEDEYERLVVLLDEPGLSLHGYAQQELVALIRSQSESLKQFVYTTHSPFMIDVDRLQDVRIVDAGDVAAGAVVREDIYQVDNDSLLPLQSALGYNVLTPLMIGPNVLFVEGVSDLLYLRSWQLKMSEDGREQLDDRWSIVPSLGSGNIPKLVSFFYERVNPNMAVLCDGKLSDQGGISTSIQRQLIERSRVVFLAEYLQKDVADIEDVFDPSTYVDIFNRTTGNEVKVGDLSCESPRILQRLNEIKLSDGERINSDAFHYKCSKTFERDRDYFYNRMTDAEKDRIEGLFKRLNAMLGDAPGETSP